MSTTAIRDKFEAFASVLNAENINRQDEVEALQVAIVARGHIFFISKPGNGKTFVSNRTVMRILGIVYFYILLTKWTADQEMFGPYSLPDLRNSGVYHRLTKGYLPEAHIAFIDEIWKGSSAMTNALLGATNERRIRNGADEIDIPLSTLICASNELPDAEHDQCAAIYDRIDLRLEVADLEDGDDLYAMLSLDIDPNPAPILTWDEIVVAQQEAAALPVTPEAKWAMVAMKRKLADQGIRISPRRLERAKVIARGAAWLAGADKVEVEHLEILRHMFWDTPDQRPVAERVVAEIASPLRKEVLEVSDITAGIEKDFAEVRGLDDHDQGRGTAILELQKKSQRTMDSALDLEDRVSGTSARSLAAVIRRLNVMYAQMVLDVMGMEGGMTLYESRRNDHR